MKFYFKQREEREMVERREEAYHTFDMSKRYETFISMLS